MSVSLKYAHVERERRWLLGSPPVDLPVESTLEITDHYLIGTRLRLREAVTDDGTVVRKLGQKIRLGEGPHEIACTSVYLDDGEWNLLTALAASTLRKQRRRFRLDGAAVAVDVFADHCAGLVLAEVDRGAGPDLGLPEVLRQRAEVVAEVTAEEAFTGAALAASRRDGVRKAAAGHGVGLS